MEGIAAQNTPDCDPAAFQYAVALNCFVAIFAAGGVKATISVRIKHFAWTMIRRIIALIPANKR